MDFDLNLDSGGDASANESSASSEIVSEGVEVGAGLDTTSTDSGADAPAEPLTTQQTDEPDEVKADEAEPTEEELEAAANEPAAPKWYRQGLERFKSRATAAETRATELEAQYKDKEVLPQPDIERLRAAEDLRFKLQSITATPEELIETIKAENPRAFPDLQNHLVWNALEKPDGTPDFDNLQFIVDKFMGGPGVSAKDFLAAGQALKAGTITSDQLHEFNTVEEYESFQRAQEREKSLEARQTALDNNAKYQETQIRTGELTQAVNQLQTQINSSIAPLMDKFKLAPVPNEPKVAVDYKAKINQRIAAVVNSAPEQIREIGEIRKAVELLGKPTGSDAQAAVTEIKSFLASPSFQQNTAKGISTLMTKIEGIVSEEAYHYKLLMLGLEQENSKAKTARPIVGAANQGANLPKLTEADLAKLSAAERREHSALQLTEELRSQKYGASRTGQ